MLYACVAVPAADMDDMGKAAFEQYRKAKDFLRQGNWAEFGTALERLEEILTKMSAGMEAAK